MKVLGLFIAILLMLATGVTSVLAQNDPYFSSSGSWGQAYGDQWALGKIGFTKKGSGTSAWDVETGERTPIIVAVLDTGLDYFHPDLNKNSIWRNPSPFKEKEDPNEMVNDLIGWNFVDNNNNPWDDDGHGTFVAGLIAAAANNGHGMAGINWGVKIMPLKIMNVFGRGRAFNVARAIVYAVDHGARVINISIESEHLTKTEQFAVDYAYEQGALIVVAAGNQGSETVNRAPVSMNHVLPVGAIDIHDERAGFSNWGPHIKIAAPGVEILSLRARRTDFMLMFGAKNYEPGESFVGPQAQFMRASGTSFAAPLVSGVVSLIWAKNPDLTNEQVERMLLESADDIGLPGWDHYFGAGRVNAYKALRADPDYFLTAKVDEVVVAQDGDEVFIQVLGTAAGSDLDEFEIQLGQGANPTEWKTVFDDDDAVVDGIVGKFPVSEFTDVGEWSVRLIVKDGKQTKEAQGSIDVG
ncbi:S8 family peptidase [Candidatus Nitronereus thalassa]|uniref:S8 family serine peptidase n=1 Tax=Candidatus Nitronereus thalassa TaxID=3020898 RepID=A0ABU3K5B8_9BACT|nr:S8 family serine peptidase [Candidatus Nitronereus thalassa]MDT7041622.1 S8 family serine peptidase [Candidatus Nitronereus thalassa]